jgi:predicted outer membrane repeat protein
VKIQKNREPLVDSSHHQGYHLHTFRSITFVASFEVIPMVKSILSLVSLRASASVRHERGLKLESLEQRDVPATFWVTNGNDSGAGSLRAALETAATGPYIDVPNEVIIDDAVDQIFLQSQLSIPNSSTLEIRLETPPANPTEYVNIRPAFGLEHDFRFATIGFGNQGEYELSGLYLDYFGTTESGGVIDYRGSQLTVRECVFEYSQAGENGGVISATGLELTIIDCGFGYENHADGHGGAVYFSPNGGVHPLTITDSQFAQNSAGGNGGAVYSRTTGTTTITGSDVGTLVFITNAAAGFGGAIYHELGSLILTTPLNSFPWISDNASQGGAVTSHSAASVYINADIRDNYDIDLLISAASLVSVNEDRVGVYSIV